MTRILCTLTFVLMVGALVAGCADDPYPVANGPATVTRTSTWDRHSLRQQSRFDERSPASDPYSDPYSLANLGAIRTPNFPFSVPRRRLHGFSSVQQIALHHVVYGERGADRLPFSVRQHARVAACLHVLLCVGEFQTHISNA